MKFQSNLNNSVNFFIFWKKLDKLSRNIHDNIYGGCNFESNVNQTKIVDFKKHSPIALSNSKKLYCHQYSADFTYFVP